MHILGGLGNVSPGEMSASSPSPGTSSASQCVSSNMDQQSMATASAGKDSLFHRLGGAIKRGCVEIFSFIFPPYYMTSENINIFTGYVVGRKNIDIFTGVANTP